MIGKLAQFVLVCSVGAFSGTQAIVSECNNWQTRNPDWIFCDDFEDGTPLVRQGRYFDHDNNNGDFIIRDGVGLAGSKGMRVRWQKGEVEAGNLKLGFGRNPVSSMNKGIKSDRTFREIYYRMYVRMQDGWQGDPAKLSRASVISGSNWAQAMIAHLWGDGSNRLKVDPAGCVSTSNQVMCTKYNDFNNLKWLGAKSGITPIFASTHAGRWFCIEHHVKLNDPGKSNGIQEFWIDGVLQARRDNLNFVGSYDAYAINTIFFENHWNSGSIKDQERYFDNIVVSTKPIGPYGATMLQGMRKEAAPQQSLMSISQGKNGDPGAVAIRVSCQEGDAKLFIHSVDGRRIASAHQRGSGELVWEPQSMPAGVYLATVSTRGITYSKQFIVN